MTPAIGQTTGTPVPEADVLTIDEEGALSLLREIVAGVRATGLGPNVMNVGEAVVAAGGSALDVAGDREVGTYTLAGARFTLQPAPGADGRIEVSFLPSG